MKRSIANIAIAAAIAAPLSASAQGGKKPVNIATPFEAIEWHVVDSSDWKWNEEFYKTYLTELRASDRKPASQQSFSEADMTPGMRNFRAMLIGGEYLGKDGKKTTKPGVKTADDVEQLLLEISDNFASYSADVQYFAAPLLALQNMRGVIWRARPIVEVGGVGFLGNKATQGQVVQMIRTAAAGLSVYLPTEQWEAGFRFLTEPSPRYTTEHQWTTVAQFQGFLAKGVVPQLRTAVKKVEEIIQTRPAKAFVWDATIGYGIGKFDDGLNRFVGHGPAEMELLAGSLWMGIHDSLVFMAYNQNATVNIAGDIGRAFGIDATASLASADIGVTDQERAAIVKKHVAANCWLLINDFSCKDGKSVPAKEKFGTKFLGQALIALRSSVAHGQMSYKILQDQPASHAMFMNPALYKPDANKSMSRSIEEMVQAANGRMTVRSPITGKTVEIDLPKFYTSPLESLAVLSPTQFDNQKPAKLTMKGPRNISLSYRNYFNGRSIGWNSQAWSDIIPSAKGKGPEYMKEVRQTLHTSHGAGQLLGQVTMFVK